VTPADAFAEVRGQDDAVALLRRAVRADRVAHAYAFVGPAGSGRKLAALGFAKALVAPSDAAAAGRRPPRRPAHRAHAARGETEGAARAAHR